MTCLSSLNQSGCCYAFYVQPALCVWRNLQAGHMITTTAIGFRSNDCTFRIAQAPLYLRLSYWTYIIWYDISLPSNFNKTFQSPNDEEWRKLQAKGRKPMRTPDAESTYHVSPATWIERSPIGPPFILLNDISKMSQISCLVSGTKIAFFGPNMSEKWYGRKIFDFGVRIMIWPPKNHKNRLASLLSACGEYRDREIDTTPSSRGTASMSLGVVTGVAAVPGDDKHACSLLLTASSTFQYNRLLGCTKNLKKITHCNDKFLQESVNSQNCTNRTISRVSHGRAIVRATPDYTLHQPALNLVIYMSGRLCGVIFFPDGMSGFAHGPQAHIKVHGRSLMLYNAIYLCNEFATATRGFVLTLRLFLLGQSNSRRETFRLSHNFSLLQFVAEAIVPMFHGHQMAVDSGDKNLESNVSLMVPLLFKPEALRKIYYTLITPPRTRSDSEQVELLLERDLRTHDLRFGSHSMSLMPGTRSITRFLLGIK
ncbi:hypothetical protein FIBSPDRAFT_891526 [Athelia psychrophila]|uniref:Uncharacterized protein n=1 Tax=Athelia psychrophila TaxID=1759441 RepID=A0A166JJD8_9AGAM|nr:hypothetical protein FIBSPDRAFT_891526 [Fibularhizoctonia sp. CBS 109695]